MSVFQNLGIKNKTNSPRFNWTRMTVKFRFRISASLSTFFDAKLWKFDPFDVNHYSFCFYDNERLIPHSILSDFAIKVKLSYLFMNQFFRVNLYLFVFHRQALRINEIRRLRWESRLTNGFPNYQKSSDVLFGQFQSEN